MAAKTKAPDSATVDAQLVSAEELRRQLESDRAAIEEKIAAGFGAPAPDLEAQHASLTARLQSVPALVKRLTQDKEQAEAEETLRLFEQYTVELFEGYTMVAELDDKIEALHEQINTLTKKRSDVTGMIQIPSGRRMKLLEKMNRHNLHEACNAIRQKYHVPKYL